MIKHFDNSLIIFSFLLLYSFFYQGVIGGSLSGKSSLIQRYITGMNPKEDVMPGKHKKTVSLRGQSNLLLIRDETGPPDYFVRNISSLFL